MKLNESKIIFEMRITVNKHIINFNPEATRRLKVILNIRL